LSIQEELTFQDRATSFLLKDISEEFSTTWLKCLLKEFLKSLWFWEVAQQVELMYQPWLMKIS
jgi:hypothetical protein